VFVRAEHVRKYFPIRKGAPGARPVTFEGRDISSLSRRQLRVRRSRSGCGSCWRRGTRFRRCA